MSDIEIMSKLLFEKFNKVALDSKEAAQALGISDDILKVDRAEAIGIPYTRVNNKPKGKVLYSITAIARTLIKNEAKTV